MVCYLDRMRFLLIALGVAASGCLGPSNSGECNVDAECDSGDVCARDRMCTSAASVRAVTVTWTLRGAAADATTCAPHPDLFLTFIGRDHTDTLGYAPVPCELGRFFIDKLPDRFRDVELGVDGGASQVRSIGSGSTVAIDLR